MHPALETIIDAANSIQRSEENAAKAFADALGVGVDDPETPSVLAVVSRNRLLGLEIDQSVLDAYRNDPVTFAVYLNTVIRGAFEDWRSDVQKQISHE